MTHRLIDRSGRELARMIRGREVSAREVVAAHLDQIEAVNPDINAIVSLRSREAVLADADKADADTADADTADAGNPLGPLHGLPVAVKDLEDVAGLPTRAGSLVTSDRPAKADGFIAARLRAAGAIIVGKTNTPEFGTGSHTFNKVFGLTRNPWNLKRSAGGSSGGAAAALASRMLPIADGSDFGGSLRNPAGFCNVVGLRPGIGRVPSPVEHSTHLVRLGVNGPMARTADDTALLLSVLGEPDSRDPLSSPLDPAFTAPLVPAENVRIGWAGDCGEFLVEPEVLDICRSGASHIESHGGSVVDVEVDLGHAMTVFRVLRGLQYRRLGSLVPRERWPEMKETIVTNIEYGISLDLEDVLEAERLRAVLHREMVRCFEHVDVIALPTAQVAPFPAEWEYPTEIAGQPMADYLEWMTACCVITPTGCPALSVPAGFTGDGLPVGLQLVAPIGQEHHLLRVGAAIEASNPLHLRVP